VDWACRQNGKDKECIQNFDEETSWKGLLRKPRRRWENNIKMCV
jgi:hypothetical protein